jgi:DNA-binding LacI/PurR family transcriptional regulator
MNRSSSCSDRKIPKYQQVGMALERDLELDGSLSELTQKELALRYDVHLLTFRHALEWLKREGKPHRFSRNILEPAPAINEIKTTPPQKVGFPVWADSLADLDLTRMEFRFRLAREIQSELLPLGYILDVQFVGPENRPNLKKIQELSKEWKSLVLEPPVGESQISAAHPFYSKLDQTVLIGAVQGKQFNCVCPDFYSAGQLAVEEFIHLGAKRILYTGRRDEPTVHQFLRVAAAESAACRQEVELLYANGGVHAEEAFSSVKRFFMDGGQCDAVLAASSYAASGAMRALADLKLRVPEQIQLISIGTSWLSPYLVPRPTAITSEYHRIGQEIVRMAIALSRNGAKPCPNALIPVHLIQGETTRTATSKETPFHPANRSEFSPV